MYYIVYGFLYLISLLPWFIMYRISDVLVILVYHIFKYRRDVVLSNLSIAFPEKTEKEREKIARDFYRLFTDTMVETIKLISISKRNLSKKFSGDPSLVNELLAQGKNVQIHAMHNFNWEIANLNIVQQFKSPFITVYMPVKNLIFERLTSDMRTRYGTVMLPATHFKTLFKKYKKAPYILTLVADQNPGTPANAYWLPFFGKMTPFVTGPEKGARLNDTAVVFGHFFPVRRGHYSFTFELVTTNPKELEEGELTRRFVEYLENCIRKYPANYLWSHRRWKHKYSPEYKTIG